MMQLPIRAFNYNDILILVSKYGTTTDIKEIVNLHIILITFFAINCIYVYKMDIRKYQHSIEQQKTLIKQQADKYYSTAIIREIYALPFHVHNIKKHNLERTPNPNPNHNPKVKGVSNRERVIYPQCKRSFNSPSPQLIQMYKLTWIKTELVELHQDDITQKQQLKVHKPMIPTIGYNPLGLYHHLYPP